MLTAQFGSLLERGWRTVFAQKRSHVRAIGHALALPCVMGRRTISRTLCALGHTCRDWSADYKMFSRSRWQPQPLFDPVIDDYLERYPDGPIAVAFDDTRTAKTGKKIATAFWQRDPMSPPFHANLIFGLRFIQAALLFPHHREGDFSARGFPVAFEEAPAVKKPGKRASAEEQAAYKQARKEQNLSTQTLSAIRRLRNRLNLRGATQRTLLATLDGSFCNKTIFTAKLERTYLLARCRKDSRLCFPADGAAGRHRRYDPRVFTPEQVRREETVLWEQTSIHFGGEWRTVRYKQLQGVLWKRGALTRPLRLIVIAPVPYKLCKHGRPNYRRPAYLLCTDLDSSVDQLIQAYFDRWHTSMPKATTALLRLTRGRPSTRAASSSSTQRGSAGFPGFICFPTTDLSKIDFWLSNQYQKETTRCSMVKMQIIANYNEGVSNMKFSTNLFSQILQIVPRLSFARLVQRCGAERHAKGLSVGAVRCHALLLTGPKPRSLREISDALAVTRGKLNHPGLGAAPPKNTLAYANAHRPWQFYRGLFFHIRDFCYRKSPGKKKKFRFKNKLLSLDATTIDLCLSLFPWADFRQTKGAVKLHLLLDHDGYLPEFAVITDSKATDVTTARQFTLPAGSIVARDRAYCDFALFYEWNQDGVFFVTRLKDNAAYEVVGNRPCRSVRTCLLIRQSVSPDLRPA